MNNSQIHFIQLLLVISSILFTNCTEEIELDPGTYSPNIVVDATLTNEYKQHVVRLISNSMIGDYELQMITGASVSVSFNDSLIYFYEPDTLPGFYYSEIPFVGVPGNTYLLNVTDYDINSDGIIDTCSASAFMPKALTIDSVGYTYIDKWEATALQCYAWDPSEKNYYNFRAWKNDTLVTDTLYEYAATDDAPFNGNYTNGITCLYFQDEIEDEYIVDGDKLTLEIQNIDKAYYDYINSAQKEYFGYNPMFGGLPANVYSNISDNAIGIFKVYTVNKASVIVTNFREKPTE